MQLSECSLRGGVWEGILSDADANPAIIASHLNQAIDGVEVAPQGQGQWRVRVPVPPSAVSDGVHTIVVSDASNDDTLATFTLIAGAPLADDMRAEIELLRAELDMLKRAFRRHCVETA